MADNTPKVLWRAGLLMGDLEVVAEKFNPKARRIGVGVRKNVKFGVFDASHAPFFLMASQNSDKTPAPAYGHNSLLTFVSQDDAYNRVLAEQFEQAAGVRYNKMVPGHMPSLNPIYMESFSICLRAGEEAAMALFRMMEG